uniref:Uncharacterized protein n=1 Tax=Glossina austeni TaxID=7395 RepID=A0A1A9UDH1_GLOAU
MTATPLAVRFWFRYYMNSGMSCDIMDVSQYLVLNTPSAGLKTLSTYEFVVISEKEINAHTVAIACFALINHRSRRQKIKISVLSCPANAARHLFINSTIFRVIENGWIGLEYCLRGHSKQINSNVITSMARYCQCERCLKQPSYNSRTISNLLKHFCLWFSVALTSWKALSGFLLVTSSPVGEIAIDVKYGLTGGQLPRFYQASNFTEKFFHQLPNSDTEAIVVLSVDRSKNLLCMYIFSKAPFRYSRYLPYGYQRHDSTSFNVSDVDAFVTEQT